MLPWAQGADVFKRTRKYVCVPAWNSSHPGLSGSRCARLPSFSTFVTIWHMFMYLLVACVCSQSLPPQVQAPGTGACVFFFCLPLQGLGDSQSKLMMSTSSVLFSVFSCFTCISLFWFSQESSLGFVLLLTCIHVLSFEAWFVSANGFAKGIWLIR